MHVLLLATDEQHKLEPLSEQLPSPLIPIVNRPVIGIALELLARAGIKRATVSLSQRSGSIAAYLGSGGRWGLQLSFAVQREPLGTAGAIRWAAAHLHETILVLPADAVLDLDIDAALAYHRATGAPATLILHEAAREPSQSPVTIDADGRVLALGGDVAEGQRLDYTGACILEPRAIQRISALTPHDVYADLAPALLAEGEVRGYVMPGYWNALETFAAYQEAQRVFLYTAYAPSAPEGAVPPGLPRVRYASIEGHQIAPGIWVSPNHAIHPEARLAAPVCIGPYSRIGQAADIGPEAIIGPHVVIDDEATVARSVVLEATYVGRLVNLEDRTVAQTTMVDMHSGLAVPVVDSFLLDAISLTGRAGWARRAVSILGALLIGLLILPLALTVAVLVVLTSGPRLLTREVRHGPRPRSLVQGSGVRETFEMWGFRTRHASGRFTLIGRWLERWHLNHLPALWNVIAGDLDLVGIRPLRPREAAQLVELWQQRRNECAAGLTGLWLVQEDTSLEAMLIADAYYVATRTFGQDARILLQTPWALLRNTYPPPEDPSFEISAIHKPLT
jgi:NDP-sugar pyrophosphorylase family protein